VKLAKKVLLVFALLVVIGGIQGMMAGSAASLIAAVISGALLLYSRWLWGEKNLPGLIVGLVVSIALLGRFASVAVKDGLTMWPGGVVIFFSVVTIVVLIAAFLQEKKSASGSQEAQPAGEASVDDAGQAEAEEAEDVATTTTTTATEAPEPTPEETEEVESSEDA
tara:strand:- start:33 stop:530 length:498 start_codon:yes stop_codon:yes gene_type:complete